VLYADQSTQTSSSFNGPAEANRFKDVVDRLGPAEALRIWKAAKPSEGHIVAGFIAQQIEALSGVEKKTLAEYRGYLNRDIEPVQNKVGFLSGCLNAAV
jgi:hypothetical protein